MTAPRILVTDDQNDVLEALRLLLKSEGYACVTCLSPAAALDAVKRERFDAALIDLNYTRDTTSGQEGLELLAQCEADALGQLSRVPHCFSARFAVNQVLSCLRGQKLHAPVSDRLEVMF